MFAAFLHPLFLFTFATALACWPGWAVAQKVVRAELVGAFNERLNPDVVVSGSVVVGVSSTASFDGAGLTQLAVYPVARPTLVCLTVESHDGVYSARNEYAVSGDVSAGAPVQLPYDSSKYLQELAGYADQSIALRATQSPCADAVRATAVLPLQRMGHLAERALRFYVNSMGATDVFISTDTDEGSCRLVPGRQTSFDYLCEISMPDLTDANSTPLRVRVERERYGRPLPVAEVEILRGL
jgi:hypothetical protein